MEAKSCARRKFFEEPRDLADSLYKRARCQRRRLWKWKTRWQKTENGCLRLLEEHRTLRLRGSLQHGRHGVCQLKFAKKLSLVFNFLSKNGRRHIYRNLLPYQVYYYNSTG